MTSVDPTIRNPAIPGLPDLLDALKREIFKDLNAVKIGEVQSFDPGGAGVTASVTVKIAQQQVTSQKPDGTRTIAEYPLLLKVPVYFAGGGGFTLTFPIKQGDECLLLFNDRELDNWMATGAGSPPTTGRLHDMSDALALVGLRSNPRALENISTTTTQLRADDGSAYVEVAEGVITMMAPIVNIVAGTQVNIVSPITTITGILEVQNVDGQSEPCTVHGDIVTDGDVIANGVSLEHHIHSGVQGGGGNSGPPVP